MISAKLKIKLSVYFVPSVFSFIIKYLFNKFVAWKKKWKKNNKKKPDDRYRYNGTSRNNKKEFGEFIRSILAANDFVIYLPLIIINGNLLK